MVGMPVGDQDVGNGLALQGRLKRLEMRLVHRTGIDHCHLAVPDNIHAGADIGEGAGIVGDHAPDQR